MVPRRTSAGYYRSREQGDRRKNRGEPDKYEMVIRGTHPPGQNADADPWQGTAKTDLCKVCDRS